MVNEGRPGRIDHAVTFLRTRDPGENRRFYEGLLGLPVALDQGTCVIYRACPGAYFGFCADAGRVPQPPSSVVLTLVTEDVEGWHRALTAAGASTDGPPRFNADYRIVHFYAADPDGYRVEVQRFEDPRWQPDARTD